MDECPVCKSTDGCEFTGKYLGSEKNLSVEDWREIHRFIRFEFLPLLHRLIYRADKRIEEEGLKAHELKDGEDGIWCPRCGDVFHDVDVEKNPEKYYTCPICLTIEHEECRNLLETPPQKD